jgi:hypothetical protein
MGKWSRVGPPSSLACIMRQSVALLGIIAPMGRSLLVVNEGSARSSAGRKNSQPSAGRAAPHSDALAQSRRIWRRGTTRPPSSSVGRRRMLPGGCHGITTTGRTPCKSLQLNRFSFPRCPNRSADHRLHGHPHSVSIIQVGGPAYEGLTISTSSARIRLLNRSRRTHCPHRRSPCPRYPA